MNRKFVFALGAFALLLFAACDPVEQEQPFPEEVPDEDPFVTEQEIVQDNIQTNAELPEVVASLNGVEISRDEVSSLVSQAQVSGQQFSPEQAVNQIAINMILESEAEERGVEADISLVEELLRNSMAAQGITEADLEAQGMTFEDILAQQQATLTETDLLIIGLIEDEKESEGLNDVEAEQSLIQFASQELESSDFQIFIESQPPVEQEIVIE